MDASATSPEHGKVDWNRWLGLIFEFSALAYLPALFFSRSFSSRAIEIGVLVWIVWEIAAKPRQTWRSAGVGLLGFFAASHLLSGLFSFQMEPSLREAKALLPSLLFCLALQRMPLREGFWNRCGVVAMATLLAIGVDVLTQSLSGTSLLSDRPLYKPGPNSEPRVTGPFSNPNFLFVVPVLAASIWIFPKRDGWRRYALVALATLGMGLGAWAVLLSGSRNVYLAAACFVVVSGWFLFRWKGLLGALGLIAAIGLAVPQGKKVWQRFTNWGDADHSRLSIWKFDLEVWKENPWLGIGPKMFGETVSSKWEHYQPLAARAGLDLSQRIPQHAHNAYLEALVERGALGLVSFLALIAHSLRRTFQAFSSGSGRRQEARFLGLALSLSLLCGFFDFSLSFRAFSYLLLFLCGACCSLPVSSAPIPPPAKP